MLFIYGLFCSHRAPWRISMDLEETAHLLREI